MSTITNYTVTFVPWTITKKDPPQADVSITNETDDDMDDWRMWRGNSNRENPLLSASANGEIEANDGQVFTDALGSNDPTSLYFEIGGQSQMFQREGMEGWSAVSITISDA
jgi:hypothetical protein